MNKDNKSRALQVAEYFTNGNDSQLEKRVTSQVNNNGSRLYTFYFLDNDGNISDVKVFDSNLYPNFLNKTIELFPDCEFPTNVAYEALEIFKCITNREEGGWKVIP